MYFFNAGKDNFSVENVAFTNDDEYLVITSTDHLIQILDLKKLNIRVKIDLKDENITKLIASKLYKHIVYLGSSNGRIYVLDSRGTGTIQLKEQLHCSGIMDFALSENEQFVITSSIDRTINQLKIDPQLIEATSSIFFN